MESDDTHNSGDSIDAIDAIAASDGSIVLAVDDVAATALELADRLSADIVEGAAALESALGDREDLLAQRVAAHAALELLGRADDSDEAVGSHVVTDIATMRHLVERIAAADSLVEASREAVQSRAMAASEIAVHPTSIRDAADAVVDARAALAARQAELDACSEDEPEPEPAPDEAESLPEPTPPRRFTGWRLTDARALGTPVLVVGVALVIGVLALVLTGSPLALAVPGVAVCWVVVLIVRQRDDAYDEELASRNLANVTRLTEQAYGGAEAIAQATADSEDPVVAQATRAVQEAENRLAFAEASWRSLVGPDADVDDVDSVLMAHDARYRLGDHAVEELPAVRTADAHRRRLLAQWKLAWWALDRPVPAMTAADDAVAALEADGLTTVTVPVRTSGGLSDEERRRLDDLVGGRPVDALQAAAEATVPALVVVDEGGEISADRFRSLTAQLPDDVRVVLVGPTG